MSKPPLIAEGKNHTASLYDDGQVIVRRNADGRTEATFTPTLEIGDNVETAFTVAQGFVDLCKQSFGITLYAIEIAKPPREGLIIKVTTARYRDCRVNPDYLNINTCLPTEYFKVMVMHCIIQEQAGITPSDIATRFGASWLEVDEALGCLHDDDMVYKTQYRMFATDKGIAAYPIAKPSQQNKRWWRLWA